MRLRRPANTGASGRLLPWRPWDPYSLDMTQVSYRGASYLYMPHLPGGLALTPMQEGAIGGTLLIGAAIGAVTGGIMSDRWGRRHNITILAVIFLLGP